MAIKLGDPYFKKLKTLVENFKSAFYALSNSMSPQANKNTSVKLNALRAFCDAINDNYDFETEAASEQLQQVHLSSSNLREELNTHHVDLKPQMDAMHDALLLMSAEIREQIRMQKECSVEADDGYDDNHHQQIGALGKNEPAAHIKDHNDKREHHQNQQAVPSTTTQQPLDLSTISVTRMFDKNVKTKQFPIGFNANYGKKAEDNLNLIKNFEKDTNYLFTEDQIDYLLSRMNTDKMAEGSEKAKKAVEIQSVLQPPQQQSNADPTLRINALINATHMNTGITKMFKNAGQSHTTGYKLFPHDGAVNHGTNRSNDAGLIHAFNEKWKASTNANANANANANVNADLNSEQVNYLLDKLSHRSEDNREGKKGQELFTFMTNVSEYGIQGRAIKEAAANLAQHQRTTQQPIDIKKALADIASKSTSLFELGAVKGEQLFAAPKNKK